MRIAIIGAGITGVTTAYSLLDRGYEVEIFDRQRYVAMETSFANGGQLSASNAEVWTHPATLLKGLRWMLRRDAPLRIGLRPSWHKLSWLAEFAANVASYRRNTIETARLAIEARRHLVAIAEREGIAFDLERRGILHIYPDRAGFERAREVNDLLVRAGLERFAVTPDEARTIEPALPDGLHGGFYTPSDASGDIHAFAVGLARACERRGARLTLDDEVIEIERGRGARHVVRTAAGSAGTFDAVVVCAGVASRRFAATLGDRINVYPVKGYSITVGLDDAARRAAAPWVSLLDDDAKIVTSRLGAERLRVAGTAELDGENRDIRASRVRPLVDWTRALFPDVVTEQVVPWAGLRPMTPSMMPRVGRGRREGVWYNTGHGHLGWTLACATAHLLAEAMGPAPARAHRVAATGPLREAA